MLERRKYGYYVNSAQSRLICTGIEAKQQLINLIKIQSSIVADGDKIKQELGILFVCNEPHLRDILAKQNAKT